MNVLSCGLVVGPLCRVRLRIVSEIRSVGNMEQIFIFLVRVELNVELDIELRLYWNEKVKESIQCFGQPASHYAPL